MQPILCGLFCCRSSAAGLIKQLRSIPPAPKEAGGDLKRTIGHVWAGCDTVGKAALDNKGAIFKALAGVMAVLKDTLREVGLAGRPHVCMYMTRPARLDAQ